MADSTIDKIARARCLAVVGVSEKKFGGYVYRELRKRGRKVYPLHPTRESFDGDRCYACLSDLPTGVEAAIVVISPQAAVAVVDDARRAGIGCLWFQQGADFSEAVGQAEAAGIDTITGKCIMMYAAPVTGIHRIHRFVWKLIGRV